MNEIIKTALSGLNAASKRVQASASNIANSLTSGSLDKAGKSPYTPLGVSQTSIREGGANSEIRPVLNNPFYPVYDPDSPHANAEGYIGLPAVDLANEAINLQLASTSYKANLQALKTAQELSNELLSVFDDNKKTSL